MMEFEQKKPEKTFSLLPYTIYKNFEFLNFSIYKIDIANSIYAIISGGP